VTKLAVIRRIAVEYDINELKEEVGDKVLPGVEVYIDQKNKKDIEAIMALDPRKTRRALGLAIQGIHNGDLYGREDVSGKASNMFAIKYKGKLNDRIYCKEIDDGGRKIILITAYRKKGGVNTKTKTIIEAAGKYVYDLKKNK
jgi:hypothetical protein